MSSENYRYCRDCELPLGTAKEHPDAPHRCMDCGDNYIRNTTCHCCGKGKKLNSGNQNCSRCLKLSDGERRRKRAKRLGISLGVARPTVQRVLPRNPAVARCRCGREIVNVPTYLIGAVDFICEVCSTPREAA
jgi:hypothetical protein